MSIVASATPAGRSGVTRRQIRGSALLMVGRGVSLGLNFTVQVLIVRYLSKTDYGAFAYALSMVTMLGRVSRFGMDKAASRFAAVYHERGEHERLLGALVTMAGTILALGSATVLAVFGLRGLIGDTVVSNPLSLTLLLTVVALAPMDAMDTLFQSVFAVFAKPRLIFFRRHVVGPGLKVLAVLAVMVAGADVRTLAVAYLVAGGIGLAIGGTLLIKILREAHLLQHLRLRGLDVPIRAILGFGLPMMGSDLVFVLRGTLVVALLEFFHASQGVADFRAVLPLARLNRVALDSFGFLFMPAVARLIARKDDEALNDMFWRSALWVSVLSVPVFLLTFSFAGPVTLILFGERYAGSATILAILAFGIFLQSTLALNALTLKAAGAVKRVVTIDAIALVVSLALSLLLVPRFGALGGAVSLAVALLVHAAAYQIGLVRGTGIGFPPARYLRVYANLAAVAAFLAIVQFVWSPPIAVDVLLAAAGSLLILRLARRQLDVAGTFPELLRIPLMGRFLGGGTEEDGARPAQGNVAAESIAGELRERASAYLPQERGEAATVELTRARGGTAASIFDFEIRAGDRRLALLVKAPTVGTKLAASLAEDAPRIGLWAESGEILRYEFITLRAIERHFREIGDPRFETVRALDLLPASGALAMERVAHPNLRSLLSRECGPPWRRDSGRLLAGLRNAGGWLRRFHELPPLEHSVERRTRRSEFVASLGEFADYLIEAGESARRLRAVVSEASRAAERLLPERLPMVIGHGDYAPRNVLVAADGRVVVIDTPGRWIFPLYQDLGYFLTSLHTFAPRVASMGLLLPRRRLARLEQAFLEGYFEEGEVPREALRLFEIQTLLSRWVSAVSDHRRAGGGGRPAKALVRALKGRMCARGLRCALKGLHS